MTIKSENQIYADIVQLINTALTNLNIKGWQVLQLKQPIKLTNIQPTIYVTYTTTNQRGWQYRSYSTSVSGYQKTEHQKEELLVQISALRRRTINDSVNTLNSKDILKYLRMYLLDINKGLKDLKNLGYSIYQPSEIQSPDFFDDSDNFEFMPFFNVTFIIEQTLNSPQTVIDDYTLQIRRV